MMRFGSLLMLAAALLLLAAACGGESEDPSEAETVTEEASAQQSIPFHLYVSNQSFDPKKVDITVWIDGREVIDQEFDVGSQHNWILFDLPLSEGVHQIRAEAAGEATVFEVDIEFDVETWAVLNFWKEDGAGFFTWDESDRPVAFG